MRTVCECVGHRRFRSAPLRKSHTSVLSKSDLRAFSHLQFVSSGPDQWRSRQESAGLGVPPPPLGLISHWKEMPTETKVCQQKATWELSPRSQRVTNHVENGEHQQRLLVTAAPRLGHIPGKVTWAEWHLGKRQRLVKRLRVMQRRYAGSRSDCVPTTDLAGRRTVRREPRYGHTGPNGSHWCPEFNWADLNDANLKTPALCDQSAPFPVWQLQEAASRSVIL